jgi:hypothetical protein
METKTKAKATAKITLENLALVLIRKNVEDIQGKDLSLELAYNELTAQELSEAIIYLTLVLSYISGVPYNEILEDIKDINEILEDIKDIQE